MYQMNLSNECEYMYITFETTGKIVRFFNTAELYEYMQNVGDFENAAMLETGEQYATNDGDLIIKL